MTQLDPVAMHLLHRHEPIPADDLRAIAMATDPLEVKKRPRAALLTPVWIALWYAAFFAYFWVFKRWRGWDPVLMMFTTFYFVFPIARLWTGILKARRTRWEGIRRVMLEHRYCPHCGYNLRGCPTDAIDAAIVCPECGCAWKMAESEA
ncbi:MAG: hypothetical protein ACYTJ0_08550 [Planctomycetota bacterium]